jgi:hypothetical protein
MVNVEELLGILLGMIAVVMTLSIPISYIVLRYRRARRAMELMHAERMAAIERGMELPTASLDVEATQAALGKPRTALLPGLMWLFVGLAITGSGFATAFESAPIFVGLIPIGIGLAYLFYYFLEERKQQPEKSPTQPR